MPDLRRITGQRAAQAVFNGLLTRLPSLLFMRSKILFLRANGVVIGEGVTIGKGVKVLGFGRLVMGDHVAVAHHAVLDARGGLELGQGCLVGFESVLLTYTHDSASADIPVHHQGVVSAPVAIGRNAWVGARCIVLPGVRIGAASIVGAHSVASRDIADNQVAVGSPAISVKERGSK